LAGKPDIKIVGEVSNGFAAVNKSLELQPDLILLDIGLPGLDGIIIMLLDRFVILPRAPKSSF
jgi:DNA-binding NarL/FixJ family response regulator